MQALAEAELKINAAFRQGLRLLIERLITHAVVKRHSRPDLSHC